MDDLDKMEDALETLKAGFNPGMRLYEIERLLEEEKGKVVVEHLAKIVERQQKVHLYRHTVSVTLGGAVYGTSDLIGHFDGSSFRDILGIELRPDGDPEELHTIRFHIKYAGGLYITIPVHRVRYTNPETGVVTVDMRV